jgi:hypothetical protein
MNLLLDSFWRALGYLLLPRVIVLSFLPLGLMVVASLVLGYYFWDPAVDFVAGGLQAFAVTQSILAWLEELGWSSLRSMFAPLVVLFVATPVVVVSSLLLVSVFMTPVMVDMVIKRRFVHLDAFKGGSFVGSILWSVGSTVLAIIALLVSMPLWLVPPMVLLLPPLIWGWLTYRVFTYEALAEVATKAEREAIFERHRLGLLTVGVVAGYLGAAPSLLWASGAMFIALAPLLVPLAIWIYTLVFAFASLWFAHYALAALERMRVAPHTGGGRHTAAPQAAPPPLITDVVDKDVSS